MSIVRSPAKQRQYPAQSVSWMLWRESKRSIAVGESKFIEKEIGSKSTYSQR